MEARRKAGWSPVKWKKTGFPHPISENIPLQIDWPQNNFSGMLAAKVIWKPRNKKHKNKSDQRIWIVAIQPLRLYHACDVCESTCRNKVSHLREGHFHHRNCVKVEACFACSRNMHQAWLQQTEHGNILWGEGREGNTVSMICMLLKVSKNSYWNLVNNCFGKNMTLTEWRLE